MQSPSHRKKLLKQVEAISKEEGIFTVQHWMGAGVLSCLTQCGQCHEKPACFEFQWVLLRPRYLTVKAQTLGVYNMQGL